jgi:hypothetical protein
MGKLDLSALKKIAEDRKVENTGTVIVHQENKDMCKKEDIKKTILIEDHLFTEFTEDKEVINYLKDKTVELLYTQANAILDIGKILNEVADELGKRGSSEGLYNKYLEINGYNKNTALRYRKRYELYNKANKDHTKNIIALLPVKHLEKLYKAEDLIESIEENDLITLEEIKELLDDSKKIVNKLEEKNKTEFDQEVFEFDFNFDNLDKLKDKYKELEEEKRKKINKLLLQIEKIIEESN